MLHFVDKKMHFMGIIIFFCLHLKHQNQLRHGQLYYHFGHLPHPNAFFQGIFCGSRQRLTPLLFYNYYIVIDLQC